MTAGPGAIVVGSTDYGDHDRIVRLLDPSRGRSAILARGARSGRKSWAALLQPGAHLDLELGRGRGPLPLLKDATARSLPRRAREEIERLALLAYGVELCAALAPENHEADRLFGLLLAWLALLEADLAPGAASRQALEAKALTFAGLAPALVGCAACGHRLEDPAAFRFDAGGGVHAACGSGPSVRASELLRLEALRRAPMAETVGVRAAQPAGLLADFAEWHMGAPLKARAFADEVVADQS